MNKSWQKKELWNFIEGREDGKNNRQILITGQKSIKNKQFVLEMIKNAYTNDTEEIIDWMATENISMTEAEKQEFFKEMIEKKWYDHPEEIENDIRNYRIYKDAFQKQKKYINEISIDEIINAIKENTLPKEDYAKYLLAYYCKYYKSQKNSYFQKQQKTRQDIQNICNAVQYFQQETLLEAAQAIKEKEDQLIFSIKEKKINKTIQKSITKLNQLYQQKDITLSELQFSIQKLQEDTQARIQQHVSPDRYNQFSRITEFFDLCRNIPEQFYKNPEHPAADEESEEIDLKIIEQFFAKHHIYYKKSQILQELKENSSLIQYYYFYEQAEKNSDPEKRLSLLEELVSDIRDSGYKNTEILRRLFTAVQKEIEDILDEQTEAEKTEDVEMVEDEVMPEEIPQPQKNNPTAQIGKYTVYVNSVQKNPVNLQKLIDLLSPESRGHVRWLEALIYQIGYDKVHAYLSKATTQLYIEDLDAIIRLDRQLRFEYQRILEDIEMYFRSSLTYYLTNKYDEKYATPVKGRLFYKRCYLMNHIFTDADEHFQHIGQLNDRIDAEVKNGNQQVINEFRKYKYALPFSTAAGIMSFGWLIIFFDNLNYNDKLDYLRNYYYHITPQTFSSWMNNLSALRNRCAHYYSLYRISSLKELRPIMTKDIDSNGFDDDYKHSSLFYYTIIMARLSPNIDNIEDFIDNIGILFRKASRENIYFDLMTDYSFPKSWRQILENEKSAKIRMQTLD